MVFLYFELWEFVVAVVCLCVCLFFYFYIYDFLIGQSTN